MVPFAAQGGACAIEDAYVLASECAKSLDDLASAFVRFEKIRRPRVKKIMQLSNNNRRIYPLSPPLEWGRNLGMKITPQESLQKRMDWVYGWKPEPVEPPVEWRKLATQKVRSLWKRAEDKITEE